MRVLFLSGWFPCPPDNGSKMRVFNLVKQLARRHEVILLSFAQGPVCEDRLAQMASHCQAVHTVPYVEFEPMRLRAVLGFFSRRPRSVVDTYNPQMAALVGEIGESSSFDMVLASELRTAPYASLAKGTPRVFEDVELIALWERFSQQRNLIRRARHAFTWHKTRRFMARFLTEFDACTVVSELERSLVQDLVPDGYQVTVVPNGVDLSTYVGDFGAPRQGTLIYPGALTYSANFDAMSFFLHRVFPLVRHQHPKVGLCITGRYDGVPIERLPLGHGVELSGHLPDIRPAIAQSWACIVPLRLGSGTRLKILEAMALGTPVVSTSKGAEGLAVTPEKDILIADEPREFANALVRLLEDASLHKRLSDNGRRLVNEHYGWNHIGQALEGLLCKVVKDTGRKRQNDTHH